MSFVKAKNKSVNFVQCFEENKTIGAKQLSCGKRWVAFQVYLCGPFIDF